MAEINSEQGDIEVSDFDWGFSFSDTDESTTVEQTVTQTQQAVAADLGPVITKLDAILALIPTDGIEATADVDLTEVNNKLDQIIALERVDALTADQLPEMDLTELNTKLDELLLRETTVEAPAVDNSEITDMLIQMQTDMEEIRNLDFNGDGNVDFGDINNNLADLLARQEAQEAELEAKKLEFEEFKANRLKSLENLIIPLLKNLKSNPDKAYIHWPNRSAVLDAQITKILALTR